MNMIGNPEVQAAPAGADWVKDSSTASFEHDVIEASHQVPVLVDFWAPWCGPCRQLTPTLEKVTADLKGKLRLVKINIDENQALAGQMGIQSIPAVFAFSGGRPVDGFMGALPEGEVRRFADKVIAQAPEAPPQPASLEEQIAEALAAAQEAAAAGDAGRAAEIFGMIIERAPDNAPALMGMAQLYLGAGQTEQAAAALAMVPESARTGAEYNALDTALRLAEEAASLPDTATLLARLDANPADHQARFDLAIAHNAQGRHLEAAETLIALMKQDRSWNDDGARKKLLELFEAWGSKDPATLKGRRLLSTLLFS